MVPEISHGCRERWTEWSSRFTATRSRRDRTPTFFTATLQEAQAEAVEYRAELVRIDPDRDPIGTLGIYEIVLRLPYAKSMVDLLNSPESLFESCLVGKRLVALSPG